MDDKNFIWQKTDDVVHVRPLEKPAIALEDLTMEEKQQAFELYQFEIMEGVIRSLGWEEIVRKCYICLKPKSDESYEDWSRKNINNDKTLRSYQPKNVSDEAFMSYLEMAARDWYENNKEGAENA